jgi:hypothetical protein
VWEHRGAGTCTRDKKFEWYGRYTPALRSLCPQVRDMSCSDSRNSVVVRAEQCQALSHPNRTVLSTEDPFNGRSRTYAFSAQRWSIAELLQRRPCTVHGIHRTSSMMLIYFLVRPMD